MSRTDLPGSTLALLPMLDSMRTDPSRCSVPVVLPASLPDRFDWSWSVDFSGHSPGYLVVGVGRSSYQEQAVAIDVTLVSVAGPAADSGYLEDPRFGEVLGSPVYTQESETDLMIFFQRLPLAVHVTLSKGCDAPTAAEPVAGEVCLDSDDVIGILNGLVEVE